MTSGCETRSVVVNALCFRRFAVRVYGLPAAKTTTMAIFVPFTPGLSRLCLVALPRNGEGSVWYYHKMPTFHRIASAFLRKIGALRQNLNIF